MVFWIERRRSTKLGQQSQDNTPKATGKRNYNSLIIESAHRNLLDNPPNLSIKTRDSSRLMQVDRQRMSICSKAAPPVIER